MTAIEKMNKLIPSLPPKDIVLASKFINNRQFEDLLFLVESDIYKFKSEIEDDEIEDPKLTDMRILRNEVMNYLDQLGYNNSFDYEEY